MPAITHGLGGPGPRRGARIGRPAISLYARGLDDNLPEWMVYLDG